MHNNTKIIVKFMKCYGQEFEERQIAFDNKKEALSWIDDIKKFDQHKHITNMRLNEFLH